VRRETYVGPWLPEPIIDETALSPETASELADDLAELLAEDAILYSDGGGKRPAALNPINGRDKIVHFFEGLAQAGKLPPPEAVHRVRLHGLPGLVVIDPGGAIDTIATLDVRDRHVVAIYAMRNPDKLRHLGADCNSASHCECFAGSIY
jgi:hypothetical protein